MQSIQEDPRYAAHNELFRHYSSLLFKARLSIITAILLLFAFALGATDWAAATDPAIFGITGRSLIAYLSSWVVVLLFSMETAYIRRLAQVANAASRIEGDQLFFANYRPLWHWPLTALYALASVSFAVLACYSSQFPDFPGREAIRLIMLTAPIGLGVFTYKSHRKAISSIGSVTSTQPG